MTNQLKKKSSVDAVAVLKFNLINFATSTVIKVNPIIFSALHWSNVYGKTDGFTEMTNIFSLSFIND